MSEKEQSKKENKKGISFLIDTIKGVTLGVSVAVPGLSAGTIAVAERCYDTIIDSITGLKKAFKKNFVILLPYLLGLLCGALAAFLGIKKGYDVAPFTLTGLFAGLVLGSLPVAISELRKGQTQKEKIYHILSLTLCLLVAAGLGIVTALCGVDLEKYLTERVWWMYLLAFFGGILAATSCIIPGISGSMSLMVIGMYHPILNTFIGEKSIFHANDSSFVVTGLIIGFVLFLGILVGLVFSSKLMKMLLSKHRVTTFYGILGLIVGSVISMFINSSIYPLYTANSIQTWDYIVGSLLLVFSCGIMLYLFYRSNKKNARQETPLEKK